MKISGTLSLLLMYFISIGQSIEISNPSKLPPKTGKFKIIGKNNDGIVVRLYGNDDVIDVYDESLKLVTAKTIEFKNKTGPVQYIMLNKNGAVIFYLAQDRKSSVLYAQPVNSKFIEIGKPIVIDTIYDRRELVAANLRFKASQDQGYLSVYYPFFSGGKIESIKFLLLHRNLNTLYNKVVQLNRDEKELESSSGLLDNNGTTYFILKTEYEGVGEKFDVVRINSSGDLSSYPIVTEKKMFGEPMFDNDAKNGNLVFTSFYDDRSRPMETVANGFMYLVFDPVNGTEITHTYTPFPVEFISELTGRSNVTNKSLYTFNIRKAVIRNDGGVMILAESFIKDTRELPAPFGSQPGYTTYRTTDIYQFNDIIAFSFNIKGELEWHTIMRKKQASEDDNGAYSSFSIANEKDKLQLYFLDDISASAILQKFTLYSTGTSEKKDVLAQEDKDLMLLPKMGKQISPYEMVMPSYKDGFLRLVKLTF